MTILTGRAAAALAVTGTAALLALAAQPRAHTQPAGARTTLSTLNPAGELRTLFTAGTFYDLRNPFFQNLGSNGRACVSCHVPADGWTISPARVQARFHATGGLDPLFRRNDGANSPRADVSTVEARRNAYSLLLSKALIRVGIGIPPGAEFELAAADDPYGFAHVGELSLFRRPMPTANLRCLTAVMWDGRETVRPIEGTDEECAQALLDSLTRQGQGATRGHAEAVGDLTDAQLRQIVEFEMGVVAAQQTDFAAGPLDAAGAEGGPSHLLVQTFYVGINDVLRGDYRTGAPFDANAMTLYGTWLDSPDARRRQIARGAALFNTKPIRITGVGGLNDDLNAPVIQGTCTTCHDAPNVGNHSVALPINIGIADASRRTPDLPLYTLRNRFTGQTVQTTDPGRALVTGKWKDIGKFKGPILRGLAARAPYFHDGSAKDLAAAVEFYDARFGIGLTAQERADLAAFLKTL